MKEITLIASGDYRLAANQNCQAAQAEMEALLSEVFAEHGAKLVRAHEYDPVEKHGFIKTQAHGMEVFRHIDPHRPIVVAEAVWQYSHHVLAGLSTHKAPILTVANWSGQWPGLVGLLNLNGSLTKMNILYSTLWSEDFSDEFFVNGLKEWLEKGTVTHDLSHVQSFESASAPAEPAELGQQFAREFREHKQIMGVFDEGCMGMHNAIIPDELLNPLGVFKERLSQSTLYARAREISEKEARSVYDWCL